MRLIKHIQEIKEKSLYYLEYDSDYKFDEFLKVGAETDLDVSRFIVENLLDGKRMDYEHPNMGCSTFSAYLKNGDKIFGRNFEENACVVLVLKTAPKNGYKSISVVNCSYIGLEKEHFPLDESRQHFVLAAPYLPMDGLNEKGLTIGILRVKEAPANQQRGKIGITSPTMIRLVLDKCATVEEAIKLVDEYDMHSSANVNFHYQISDSKGDSAVIEYVNHKMSIVRSKCATNFVLTEGCLVGSGHDRFEKIESRLKTNQERFESEQDAMSLLKEVSWDATCWSVVYNQTKQSLYVSVEGDFENVYKFDNE